MSDAIYIGSNADNIDVSPQFRSYTKVIIHVDNDNVIEVGNDTGRTLEFDNPFGTRAMAQSILDKLRGFRYQPHETDGAILNPAAEIGDAIDAPALHGGIYNRNRSFGRLMKADVSAPHDEEIDHEFKYVSPSERRFTRVEGEIKASLILTNRLIEAEAARASEAEGELSSRIRIEADRISTEVYARERDVNGLNVSFSSRLEQTASSISATVSAEATRATNAETAINNAKLDHTGGQNATGKFSWTLKATGHYWYANGGSDPVMSVTKDGLHVRGNGEFTGKITASSGKIGGFDIGANKLSYNDLNWSDTNKNGVYIGTSGIRLGPSFTVNTSGMITAKSLTLQGNITFLDDNGNVDGTLSAANLRAGAQSAYSNGSNWTSATNTVNSNKSTWDTGAGYGYAYNNAAKYDSNKLPDYFSAKTLCNTSSYMRFHGAYVSLRSFVINGTAHHYLGTD